MAENMKKELSCEDQLEAFAVPNAKAVVEKETDDYILIKVELNYRKMFKPLVNALKPRTHKTYQLYGLGLEVYRKIIQDHTKVRELIYWLQNTNKLSFYEARNLILQFTGDLMQKGIIVIEAKK